MKPTYTQSLECRQINAVRTVYRTPELKPVKPSDELLTGNYNVDENTSCVLSPSVVNNCFSGSGEFRIEKSHCSVEFPRVKRHLIFYGSSRYATFNTSHTIMTFAENGTWNDTVFFPARAKPFDDQYLLCILHRELATAGTTSAAVAR